MSEELVPVTSMNDLLATQTQEATPPAVFQEVSSQSWINTLTICYAISESFEKGIAKPGEFVLAGQTSLGNKIECVCFDYRVHTVLINTKLQSFEDNIFVPSTYVGSLKLHKEYQDFITQTLKADCEIQEGTDLLLYIPSATVFATIFCKKTLAASAEGVYKASRGGRLVTVSTLKQSNKTNTRSWYTMVPIPTNRGVIGCTLPGIVADISVPPDMFSKNINLFRNPAKGPVTITSESAPERDR